MAAGTSEALSLEHEVRAHDRRRRRRQLDDEVGNAIAVDVAFDEPVAVALISAKLAGDPMERTVVAEGERLIAGKGRVRVDLAEVDLVGPRREVEDLVDRRPGGGRRARIAEEVRARAAGEGVGAEVALELVGAVAALEDVGAG